MGADGCIPFPFNSYTLDHDHLDLFEFPLIPKKLLQAECEYASAEVKYRRAAYLLPSSPAPLAALARYLHGCGRGTQGEAKQLYEQVLRLEPKRVGCFLG